METSFAAAPRRRATRARRVTGLVLIACVVGHLGAAAGNFGVQFAGDARVPRPVQEFAWRVIETHCNYQSYEVAQRSFWAYQAHSRKVGAEAIYSISILSDLTWKKTEPPAQIDMTIVDNGQLTLTDLKSTYVTCSIN